jgi:nitroreductase
MLMVWDEGGRNRRHRRNYEEPVEVLAEELKEAWASYHTP